ncbi:MAG TPA: biotin/lipoyl-containing protein, partial [Chryseosolibacter sp.]|nr:biotin/lipoyl-containing protein [Chryseosolibacter sp.]
MAIQVKVPTVGESITEVTIANWLKKDGESVKLDEIIAELESDKATFELTAPVAGVLKIFKDQGSTVPIGELICEVQENGQASAPKSESKPAAVPSASTPPKATGGIKEMKVPAVGESITEVTISTWLKKDGDFVKLDEILAEVESDKATFELPAEATGILRIVAKEKTTLPIGGLICKIEIMEGAPQTAAPAAQSSVSSTSGGSTSYAAGHPSPAAAKILDEKGIATGQVSGSGVGGRITKEDAVKAQSAPKGEAKSAAPSGPPVIADGGGRTERREKMTSLRRTIAKRLVSVKNETAMLTTFNEVDMKPIMDLRSKYKDQFKEKYGVGLGFMSFFTKAVCVALKDFPAVNASIDKEEIVYHDYCDVSIAVSTPRGLVVPVIR